MNPRSRLAVAVTGGALAAAALATPAALAGRHGVSYQGLGVNPHKISRKVHTIPDHVLTFTAATVVDPQLYGGEPGYKFDPTDRSGNREFVDWPVSSRQNIGVLYRTTNGGLTYQKRYADPNDAVTTGGPACLGRQTPYCFSGGGGDTDVNINPTTGVLHFGSQEALANQAVGTSFDHGDTFPSDHVYAATATTTGVDRQWIGSVAGTHDEYLAYHVPIVGEFVNVSHDDGAVGSWSAQPAPQIVNVTQSGSLAVDSTGAHKGTLYLGFLRSGFKVGVSTDGAQSFQVYSVPSSTNVRNFTVVRLDRQGNAYATWVDGGTNQTYLSTSKADVGANRTHPGSLWSTPVQVSNGLSVTIFSNAAPGDAGRVAIGYYGTTANAKTPDDVTKGAGGWAPYAAISTNALCQWDRKPCAAPTFHQTPVAHHINQDDNICTSGTACAATGGNRNLLDYFDMNIDPQGHLGVVWTDTVNADGMGFIKTAREATGPSLYARGKPARLAQRVNGGPAPAGDAVYPFYGATAHTSPNRPWLDLRGTSVRLRDPRTLEVAMSVADTSSIGSKLAALPQNDGATPLQQAKYVTRFDVAGHVYYAGAIVARGAEGASFFAGEVNASDGLKAAGATADYGDKLAPQLGASGRIDRNRIVVDVPLSELPGVAKGVGLYSVGSYALLGPADATELLNTVAVTVDSTPTFDAVLGPRVTGAQPPVLIGRR